MLQKGGLALVLEFLLSVVILLGGGFLVYSGKAVEFAISIITMVSVFWFQRRDNEQKQEAMTKLMEKQVTPVEVVKPESKEE